MSTFDGQALFASGPVRFEVGGQTLKHAVQHPLQGQGVRVLGQGHDARRITQLGTLTADTPEALQQQVDAIEAKLDGLPYTLVDDVERVWPNTVMLGFEPEPITRLGTRWKLGYRIGYAQATG